jgi:glycosyltransferase involved in cell wall biosynthesis
LNLNEITPLILTYDEQANIRRTLAGLSWASQIVVVDSGSTDETLKILAEYPTVRVVARQFDHFAGQCNFGLQHVTTEWVLAIDADYFCPAELQQELRSLPDHVNGFEFSFVYCIAGQPLRRSLYPPRVVLFRRLFGQYVVDGHAHRLELKGAVLRTKTLIHHDDRKPLGKWLKSQEKYVDLEVAKLLSASHGSLSWQDQLRKHIVWAPLLMPLYCLVWKGLIFDGWPGVFYTLQRLYAELLLSLKLLEAKFTQRRATTRRQGKSQTEQAAVGEQRTGVETLKTF